jgi:hypothetical protein
MLVFLTQLCELLPMSPSLWFKYTEYYTLYTYAVCKGGGGYEVVGGEGASDRSTPAAKYFYCSIYKKSRHVGFGVFIHIWSMVGIVVSNFTHL